MRARKTADPCEVCSLHKDRCICDLIPKLDLKTRITLIIHAKELKRTTNSGTLALAALKNSEMIVRGLTKDPVDLAAAIPAAYENLLFYPSEDAIELNTDYVASIKKPINLLVPDGNWRQAGKVHIRHKEISHLPRVMIKKINTAQFHLRAEHNEFGMSTLEAIARALGFIEDGKVEAKLLELYQAKLKATLAGRGIAFGNDQKLQW